MALHDYDILIIGGGPGGYVAGSYAAQFGKRTAVIEKQKAGGCCLNTGCIPTKIILEAANRFSSANFSEAYGVKAKEVSFDWKALKAFSEKTREDLTKGVKGLLRSRKCELINGEASILDAHTVRVGGDKLTAETIIIATGAKPILPKKFASITRVITSDSFWNLEEKPESIVIVGGGVIGCEIASALSRLGTKVTIIEQLPELLAQFDSEAIELLKKDLISNGVQILCGYSVDEIKDEVESLKVVAGKVDRENNVESIKTLSCNADYVLWATGRKAVIPDCELDELKLTDRNFVEVDSNYRTGIDNIYCIGDANGKSMLAHAAIYQAMLVINHICTGKTVSTNPSVPSTVFTNPQIAALGLRESECADKNIAVGKVPYAAVGYSHVIEDSNGYFKIIRDIESDTIIGAEIVGHNACELIHTLAPYINKKLDTNMFSDIILAHPTLTEGIKLAVEASYIRSPQF